MQNILRNRRKEAVLFLCVFVQIAQILFAKFSDASSKTFQHRLEICTKIKYNNSNGSSFCTTDPIYKGEFSKCKTTNPLISAMSV